MKAQRVAAIAILLGAPAVAWAGTGAAVASKPTERALTANTAQIALLKQQREIAKLKAEIAASKTGGSSSTGTDPRTPAYGQNPAMAPQQASAASSLPEIVSIVGGQHGVQAVLRLSSGAEVIASPGEALAGGLTVHTVDADGVSVMQSGNLVPLAFATGTGDERRQAREPTPLLPPGDVMVPPKFPPVPGGRMPGDTKGH